MKHTPGPWFAWRNSCYWEISANNPDLKKFSLDIGNVCSSAPSDRDGGLQEANARLIAAAPELLEALIKAKELLEQSTEIDFDDMAHIAITSEDECDMRELIESAIAKARGEA